MAFNDGTAEARVAARYERFGSTDDLGRAIQATEREARAKRERGEGVTFAPESNVTNIRRATEKQIAYLTSLSRERFPHVTDADIRAWAVSVDRQLVSAKIDWLKTQPVMNSGVGTKRYDVPAGRYAVTGERGQTVFVRVEIPAGGLFKGQTFVRVQASDDLHRVSPAVRDALLAKIEADGPKAACERYGREIGDCGRCGRTLTDETSRELGIGPTCRNKGW